MNKGNFFIKAKIGGCNFSINVNLALFVIGLKSFQPHKNISFEAVIKCLEVRNIQNM